MNSFPESVSQVLSEAWRKRNSRNLGYSLRSFARDLKMSPGTLSRVLNRKNGLSLAAIQRIGGILGFNEDESRCLYLLSISEFAKSSTTRKSASLRLQHLKGNSIERIIALKCPRSETWKILVEIEEWLRKRSESVLGEMVDPVSVRLSFTLTDDNS